MKFIDIKNALNVPGWMTAAELSWLAEQASHSIYIAEIGCYLGRSTRAMADNTSGYITVVDTFEAPGVELAKELGVEGMVAEFKKNVPHRVHSMMVMPSLEAAARLRHCQFDFIFIDASHDYTNVKKDIQAWLPLLQTGGVLAGHDYSSAQEPYFTNNGERTENPGVIWAVRELLPDHQRGPGSIWYWTKP